MGGAEAGKGKGGKEGRPPRVHIMFGTQVEFERERKRINECGGTVPDLAACDEAVRRDPGSGEARMDRAEALAGTGRIDDALEELDRAAQCGAPRTETHAMRGILHMGASL